MGRDSLRLAMWALAGFTALAFAGNQTAFAATPSSVNGGGWFSIPCFTSQHPEGCPANFTFEVNFGLTGRSISSTPPGHFNYHNRQTGFHANGVANLVTTSSSDSSCPGTGPIAHVSGSCPDGSCSFFEMIVQDNGNPGKANDEVCKLVVTGPGAPAAGETNNGGDGKPIPTPLNGGNIQVRLTQ